MADMPFESIESAQEYLRLLALQVEGARSDVEEDTREAVRGGAARRVDALRMVDYKLKQLSQHLGGCSRILNDLRLLRRLLVEREAATNVSSEVKVVGAGTPRR